MNPILNDESYSVEERLEMAKELLRMHVKHIDKLVAQADEIRTRLAWIEDQAGDKRMGL